MLLIKNIGRMVTLCGSAAPRGAGAMRELEIVEKGNIEFNRLERP